MGIGSDFVCLINHEPVTEMSLDLAPGQGQTGLGVEALGVTDTAQVDFSDFEIDAP